VRHLWYWQGLRWAPGGLLLLATAGALTVPLPAAVRWVVWTLILVGAARMHGIAAAYYARRFPTLRPGARTAGGYVVSSLLIGALAADVHWTPPVLVTALVGALALLGYSVGTGGGRPHHAGVLLVLLGVAALPAFGVMADGRPRVLLWLVVSGALYLAVAVLDHRELAVCKRHLIPRAGAARPAPVRRVQVHSLPVRRIHPMAAPVDDDEAESWEPVAAPTHRARRAS
jgi:hypothetical protein